MKRVTKIIIIVVILVIVLGALVYFLFLNKSGMLSLGFGSPDYSAGANVGGVVGQATDSNPYSNVKLNPFRNET